ncbi:MAG: hypothetical protein F6K40_27545 [Okeania sp. SIO3I5]|uniref:hypothetical protein n=1 Tax=Okeania sp. SIO3I5 TaxID=2607805 RepID=UPI0013BD515E|nr:hypothetical protein [Okeania sp. SIO3I5]NEQ39800.1 hypothetical protein [Okeania sp. SIO3I5]
MTKTRQEIIRQGHRALIDSLGIVDAIRFLQYYSSGYGDYTQERHQWLDQTPLEDILTSMKQQAEDNNNQYDEIIQ